VPFNICNSRGEHIGFLHRTFPGRTGVLMVAVSEQTVESVEFSVAMIKSYLAGAFRCRTITGKVNEEKLEAEIARRIDGISGDDPGFDRDYDQMLKNVFLRHISTGGQQEIENYITSGVDMSLIRGYVLFDVKNLDAARTEGNQIIIPEEINYLEDDKLEGTPVFARVTDYPVLHTAIMGAGEGFLLGANLADFGGRNHAHTTELKIESGNFTDEIKLPIYVLAARGMSIQLYLEHKEIRKVLCGGAVYSFS